jgi:hypothetical protein
MIRVQTIGERRLSTLNKWTDNIDRMHILVSYRYNFALAAENGALCLYHACLVDIPLLQLLFGQVKHLITSARNRAIRTCHK